MSKDDQYWHRIMHAVGDEFMAESAAAEQSGDPKVASAWAAAAEEIKATADQALKTAGTAERLVGSRPN